jgi:beta-lactamase class C
MENPHWLALMNGYEQYLQESLQKNKAPGVAIAIVRDSSILYLKGFGYRDYSNQELVNINSVFRLGSVSKSLASVLVGRLVQEGILNWNDKVVKHVPSFRLKSKEYTDSLTIAHLLSHTSGLPYHAYTDRVDEGVDFDTLVYHLRDLDLVGPPGKVYSYQNVAFSVVSQVIEAATGKTYEAVMKEKIFEPVEMNDASLSFSAMASTTNKARPHQFSKKEWRPLPISFTYYNVGPAGGVNASVSDMAKWLRTLTNPYDTLLTTDTKAILFTPAVKAIARNRNFLKWKRSKGSYYAMGWRILTFKNDTINYHGGYVNGFRSEVAIKRNDRLGICVLVNSAGPLADHAIPEFLHRYETYRSLILQWERENAAPLLANKNK